MPGILMLQGRQRFREGRQLGSGAKVHVLQAVCSAKAGMSTRFTSLILSAEHHLTMVWQ